MEEVVGTIQSTLLIIGVWLLCNIVLLIHELGHALVARSFGAPVSKITLGLPGKLVSFSIMGFPVEVGIFPLIGGAHIDSRGFPWIKKLLIAAAGPTSSLIAALAVYYVLGGPFLSEILSQHLLIWPMVSAFINNLDLPLPDIAIYDSEPIKKAVLFFANINLTVAVLNMLPVPALDGGRIVLALLEGATRGWSLKFEGFLIGISFWIFMIWLILR